MKQFIARKRFQDVLQRLAVVAVGREIEMLDEACNLDLEQRDFARIRVVGRRGPQAEKAALTDEPAFLRAFFGEYLDSHVVEISGAMHRRGDVRLGHESDFARAAAAPDVARQNAARGLRLGMPGTQDAEARLRQGRQGLTAGTAAEPIFTVAEKREVPIDHPGEQRAGLAKVLRLQASRRLPGQTLCRVANGRLHERPIRVGDAHVGEVALDFLSQGRERIGGHDAVDFDVLEGFEDPACVAGRVVASREIQQDSAAVAHDGKDRMGQEVQRESAARQGEADRVDEKRHVIADHLDDRVRRAVAILAQRRIEHTHERRARLATAREAELRRGDRSEGLRLACGEILRVDGRAKILEETRARRRAQPFGRPKIHVPTPLVRPPRAGWRVRSSANQVFPNPRSRPRETGRPRRP